MAFKKQEFYEGAALHVLARTGQISALRYAPPFFEINGKVSVLLKYSTRSVSPWGFTFTGDEQVLLRELAASRRAVIGLICGSDGVAAFEYEAYCAIAPVRETALHVACYRRHGEHYEVKGPDGSLPRKIAPANWQKILDPELTRS